MTESYREADAGDIAGARSDSPSVAGRRAVIALRCLSDPTSTAISTTLDSMLRYAASRDELLVIGDRLALSAVHERRPSSPGNDPRNGDGRRADCSPAALAERCARAGSPGRLARDSRRTALRSSAVVERVLRSRSRRGLSLVRPRSARLPWAVPPSCRRLGRARPLGVERPGPRDRGRAVPAPGVLLPAPGSLCRPHGGRLRRAPGAARPPSGGVASWSDWRPTYSSAVPFAAGRILGCRARPRACSSPSRP